MDFYEVLEQMLVLLQQHGRISYRALKRQFSLDDEYLEDLTFEIIRVKKLAVDEDDEMLVWTGDPAAPEADAQPRAEAESRFHAILPVLTGLLQREGRITYHTLMQVFSLDEVLLGKLREELSFKGMAQDQNGKGLVWTGEAQPPTQFAVPTRSSATSETTTATPAVTAEPTHPITDDVTAHDEHGALLESSRTSPEAERRQLTVMFCDLADSTKLSQQLDPEDLREVVRAYQATAAEVVQQYAGHMAQYLGDGLLIYFGWPQAHEDDAQRAAHAGLGIVEALTTKLNPRLEREKGVQLTVRLGIHTGPVVVGEMGGGGRHENLATGETVNIASRLEGLAAPNTVLLSNVTARLVRGMFALEDLGPHEFKGMAEPMPVFRVLGPMEDHEDETAAVGVPFLVGRDEEVGLLMRRWEQAKAQLGQVVLISGEAGIGKSSLLAAVRAQVMDEGYRRLTFRCSPYHTHSALYPVIMHLEHMLGFDRDDGPDARLDKLEQALQTTDLPLQEAVPLLATLLSVPSDDRYPAPTLSPQQHRQQTLDTLVGWLLEEAEHQPVLAMWEDLHWADPSTLEMLGLILEQTPTVSMLHVLTYRPAFKPPWPSRSHLTPITLNRLERPQVEALIVHLAGSKTLPGEVAEHLVNKTDGVPLFIEELTKMVLASDLLREEVDQYVLTGPLLTMAIPDTLQDSLMARLDQLSAAKEIAQLGAVLGREFSYHMLQALSDVDETTLQEELDQLVQAELLYQRGRPPRSRYIFKHALIQDAAYASLLKRTRQQLHQRVAEGLEAMFPEITATQPELVAHHYTEAGGYEPAVTYWQHAVERARQRQALVETVEHCNRGLALLSELPETHDHIQQEIVLQVALGTSLQATTGFGATEAEQALERAWQLCQQLDDTPQLFPVLVGLFIFYFVRADYRTSQELSKQLLTIAERLEDPQRLTVAHFCSSVIALFRGDFQAARAHATQGIRHYDVQHHAALVSLTSSIDPGVGCYIYLAESLRLLGYADQAAEQMQTALQIAQDLNHPHTYAYALLIAQRFRNWRREWPLAITHAETLLALADAHGFGQFAVQSLQAYGYALAKQGHVEEGMARIQERNARAYISALVRHGYSRMLFCEMDALHGQWEQALEDLDDILLQDEQAGGGYSVAECHRLKGEWLLQLEADHQSQAEASFQQALTIARQQGNKWGELRAAASLARLWQQQDKRQDAHDLLAPVYGWFSEGF
ncbi:MAG: AAA family ATPase, partial [bacterium]|nr:AAA family ATPase [bacterium]